MRTIAITHISRTFFSRQIHGDVSDMVDGTRRVVFHIEINCHDINAKRPGNGRVRLDVVLCRLYHIVYLLSSNCLLRGPVGAAGAGFDLYDDQRIVLDSDYIKFAISAKKITIENTEMTGC